MSDPGKAFTVHTGIAAVLDMANVDTDVIIRVERCARCRRGEFGRWAFEVLRYEHAAGAELPPPPKPDFVLNQPPFDRASVLIAGPNFGCGSSREPAVWAIQEMGFRCVIAPSFGDIFANNCFENLLPAIALPRQAHLALVAAARLTPEVTVDLRRCQVRCGPLEAGFEIEPLRREMLLQGRTTLALVLARMDEITAFERQDRARRPWLHP